MKHAALVALSLLAWLLVVATAMALPPLIAGHLLELQVLPGITH